MEIEAKFNVPNATVLAQLNTLPKLAGFSVLPGKVKSLRDCYLDTANRRIFQHGYVLRRRRQADGDWVISLKSLGGAEGAIHRREEVETKVIPQLKDQAPETWQQSDVYAQLQTMLGDATLNILFCLTQTRTVHRLADAERVIAEYSLDEVHVPVNDTEIVFYEVEVELKKKGTEDDLRAIVQFLQENYFLQPELRSKFERAWDYINAPASKNAILTDAERHVLRRITEIDAGTNTYSRRAQALLAIDEGVSGAKAAFQSDLSERQVRHWRSKFKKDGVRIFPERVLEKAMHREPPPLPAITGTDNTTDVARKLLWHTLQNFRGAELGARLMFKSALLDEMLFATRKLATAIRDFAAFTPETIPDDALDPLDALTDLLIEARNTLALLERTEAFFAGSKSLTADGFFRAGETLFHRHRANLRAFFDGDAYQQMHNRLNTLLQVPDAWQQAPPTPVRLVIPIVLYLRLADVLSQPIVNNTPEDPAEALAQIAQFSASLAMFEPILGRDMARLAKPLRTANAGLQELFDLSFAETALNAYRTFGQWDANTEPLAAAPADDTAVEAYLATVTAERAHARNALATAWATIATEKYWHKVGNAVKRL